MKNDGGSAFPVIVTDYNEHTHEYENTHSVGGVTLRDYFAAKAMRLFAKGNQRLEFAEIAKRAYFQADAMLKARDAE